MLHSDAVLDKAQELKASGTPFVLATVVRCESPTSAKPGAKALVTADGELIGWIGGGCAQPAVLDTAKKALKDGQARLIRVSPTKGGQVEAGIIDFGMTCHSGGTLDIFIDPVIARPALLIIGASPAAQTLGMLAHHAGFAVHAAFPGADAEMFPQAVQIIDGLELETLRCGLPPMVVVATQGKRDEPGLEAALTTASPYIAFIASERKADKLRAYLKERGQDPVRVDAIISPAGVEIGAVTPEEIAVSVLAGLIQARRDEAMTESLSAVSKQAETGRADNAASSGQTGGCCGSTVPTSATDPVCGMSVQIAGAEFVSHHQGRSYYFCCAGCQHAFDKDPQGYPAAQGVG
jgi:xanthine dehydrogenase accessory factor